MRRHGRIHSFLSCWDDKSPQNTALVVFLFYLQLRAVILHGNEIISKLYVIAVQMPTLWNQCKRDTTYAPWPRWTKDFMRMLIP